MSESDIRGERVRKLDILKEAGMEPYPARTARDTTAREFSEGFASLEADGASRVLAGRLMSRRGQGGIIFADLNDGTGRAQIVLQRGETDDALFDLFERAADIGDFIEARGTAFRTQRGQPSLKVAEWKMLAKSLLPMPSEHFGVKDEETVLRQRYLDILLNPETRALFERRSAFWRAARGFYLSRGFLEVETPVLETTPGGADARPFVTRHNALDLDVYLRISCGELRQKELLVAGYPKVFEIGRIFRNEGQSREHLQDYTQLESYEAYSDLRKGMRFIQELYRHIAKEVYGKYSFAIGEHEVDFAEEWEVIDFCGTVGKRFGVNPLACTEEDAIRAVRDAKIEVGEALNLPRAVDHLWKSIRKTISGPAFLTGVPAYMEPLAKRMPDNPSVVERFQVILAGSEMGKGFSELNDPLDQRKRFAEQQRLREQGDDEAQRMDEDYVRAMEYGMPPAFGFGTSERLFSFLENRPAHEAQIFPLLRPQSAPVGGARGTMVATVVLNQSSLDASWKELNTTAHLAASFAARQGKSLFWRDSVVTKDGVTIPLNIQHAVMIKTARTLEELRSLMRAATHSDVTVTPFTREMLETTNDKKVAAVSIQKAETEIEYLGVLVFGRKDTVDNLTREYPLHP